MNKFIPKIVLHNQIGTEQAQQQLDKLVARLHTADVNTVIIDLSQMSQLTFADIEMLENICEKYERIEISGAWQFRAQLQMAKAKFYPKCCPEHQNMLSNE